MDWLQNHLLERNLCTNRYSFVSLDEQEGVVVFPLWNLSGQMVGYQQYRPFADKKRKNHPKEGRYYTFLSGDKGNKMIGVWGLESYDYRKDVLVICEGVFDACQLHNQGIPAIALLNSSYKHYRNFLTSAGRKIYKVQDDHGSSLGPYENLELPSGVSDLGECSEKQLVQVVKQIKLENV